MSVYDIPDWLHEKVRKWTHRLIDATWEVKMSMSLAPGGDASHDGVCRNQAAYRTSALEFAPDLEDATSDEIVAHEVVHIAHASLDYVVREVIIGQLPDTAQDVAMEAYNLALEQFVTQLARNLVAMEAEGQGEGPDE